MEPQKKKKEERKKKKVMKTDYAWPSGSAVLIIQSYKYEFLVPVILFMKSVL
jgi:hypothetical protein